MAIVRRHLRLSTVALRTSRYHRLRVIGRSQPRSFCFPGWPLALGNEIAAMSEQAKTELRLVTTAETSAGPPPDSTAGKAKPRALMGNLKQVAALTGWSHRTVKRLHAERRLPGLRDVPGLRNPWYYLPAIEQWLADGCPAVEAKGRRSAR